MRVAVHLVKKLGRRRGQLNALGGLVYLPVSKSNTRYLVDTGAAVSVLPHSSPSPSSGQPLTGADGKPIASWGTVMRCSARDWERSGLLGGIPRVVVQISALTLKGPL
jgi:hypothetical protein